MKDIIEAIKEKRAAITRLQADLEILERARALLNGGATDYPTPLSVVLGEAVSMQGRVKAKIHPRKGKFHPKSSVGQAVAVLREAGAPLHIADILSGMKKRGMEAKKGSLWSTLAKLSKRGSIFYKTRQPSTFGLLEWEKAKATAQS